MISGWFVKIAFNCSVLYSASVVLLPLWCEDNPSPVELSIECINSIAKSVISFCENSTWFERMAFALIYTFLSGLAWAIALLYASWTFLHPLMSPFAKISCWAA